MTDDTFMSLLQCSLSVSLCYVCVIVTVTGDSFMSLSVFSVIVTVLWYCICVIVTVTGDIFMSLSQCSLSVSLCSGVVSVSLSQ